VEAALSAELLAAALCYVAEHDLMWEARGLVGGIGRDEETARKLAEPGVRRAIVSIIQQSRDKDIEASGCLEQPSALAS
jgi:hypothetical protein